MLRAGLVTPAASVTGVGITVEISGNTRISTLPSGVTRGVTRSRTPTLRRSTAVVTRPVAVTFVDPTIGTSWPMLTAAVWLSSVITWGQLSTSSRPWVLRARTSRLNELLWAENTNPPAPPFGDTRPTLRFPSPWTPTTPGLMTELFGRAAVLLKLNAGCPTFSDALLVTGVVNRLRLN